MPFYVYIMASKQNGTLYTGTTRDLVRRVWEHKNDVKDGFTKRCSVHMLVWFEETPYLQAAVQREKQIKAWKRKWKLELIEKKNPGWKDLYSDLI
jgi:putative endonuclease